MRLSLRASGAALALTLGAALASPAGAAPAAPVGAAAAASTAPDLAVTEIQRHLAQLQSIADANGGNRATGRPGYQASVDWVEAQLRAAGYTTTRQTFSTSAGTSYNVIAERTGSVDPGSVVMLGGHLDSVSSGPGINDNGTGTAGVLEAALAYARSGQTPRNTIRFGFWGAEEQGLLGSKHYVNGLSSTERARIKAYVNADMIGSPNRGYFVYDDNAKGAWIRDDLLRWYADRGITADRIDVQGRSDHAAFRALGLPTGGIYSGGETVKSLDQANRWGGTAYRAFDPCYHQACDTLDNVDLVGLDVNADALAHLLWTYSARSFVPARNLLTNPGFESGSTGWQTTGSVITTSSARPARTGTGKAWLGGNGRTSTETLEQTVTIPAEATSPYLGYWLRIDTDQRLPFARDTLTVEVISGGTARELGQHSNTGATSGYVQHKHDLSAYRGQTVTVRMTARESAVAQTSFVVDDTALFTS